MQIIGMEHFGLYGSSNVGWPSPFINELSKRGYILTAGNNRMYCYGSSLAAPFNVPARTGNFCIGANQSSFDNLIEINANASDVIGVAGMFNIFTTGGGPNYGFYSLGLKAWSTVNNVRLAAVINNLGGFNVYLGNILVGQSANNLWSFNNYFSLEFCARRNNGGLNTGEIQVRYNGDTIIIVQGLNIPNQFNKIQYGRFNEFQSSQHAFVLDDIYWQSGAAGEPFRFLGDRKVQLLPMSSDRSPQDLAYSSGANGFSILNRAAPNDDQYIFGDVLGASSVFGVSPPSFSTNSIGAMAIQSRAFKNDAGAASFSQSLSAGGIPANGSNKSLATSSNYFIDIFETNPQTGNPWLPSELPLMRSTVRVA